MKISYVNFDKAFPGCRHIFNKGFSIARLWDGKLIYITFKHRQITIDLRTKKSLAQDMTKNRPA